MGKLFLTSSVHAVAESIARRVSLDKGNSLVFIDTAAEVGSGDKSWLDNDRQALVKAGFAVTDYTITGKTRSELSEALMRYEYIYLSGGDEYYLYQQSLKSGFDTLVKQLVFEEGKTYIGTSAGSIIAGPRVPAYLYDDGEEVDVLAGFGLVNFTLVPHWGQEYFRERYLSRRLEIAYRTDQVPLVVLTDSQYVQVKDEFMRIIDVDADQ